MPRPLDVLDLGESLGRAHRNMMCSRAFIKVSALASASTVCSKKSTLGDFLLL